MSLKAKELNLTFDLDEFSWGDYLDIRSNDYERFLNVCARLGKIEGKTQAEVREMLCQLSFYDVAKIDTMLAQAMQARSNPKDETGKN